MAKRYAPPTLQRMLRKIENESTPHVSEIVNYAASGGFLDDAVAPGCFCLIERSVGALGKGCD